MKLVHLHMIVQCECGNKLDAHALHAELEFTCPDCKRLYRGSAIAVVRDPASEDTKWKPFAVASRLQPSAS